MIDAMNIELISFTILVVFLGDDAVVWKLSLTIIHSSNIARAEDNVALVVMSLVYIV